ncbi:MULTISPECIES: hypothetical protein [unclassified Pseudomonas]|jgi:hypothetical protein|uniref:hypothetical protein n=1 Tax=unclassified Pseudomonas TaxID=196821 RepID=UPI001942736B|nr:MULTISPECIES: hypothetical protein [unclassified Pseudomonas]MDC0689701.1 hypothetical protein [Mitsuaria sp. RG]MCE0914604.1 hypothetical protein [Pseudomonas sp. NMI760_13]MCF1490455.1 hypothetical protein [Pseudomonas sp. AA27]MCP8633306.1 hypothetical protein [Pseudomonas sp. DVZ6]MDD7782811.1 hypothetical protein [Pseudomonas sp. DVZ24]
MDEEIKDQHEVNSDVAYFEAIAVEKLSRLLASKQYGSFLTDEVIDAFKNVESSAYAGRPRKPRRLSNT